MLLGPMMQLTVIANSYILGAIGVIGSSYSYEEDDEDEPHIRHKRNNVSYFSNKILIKNLRSKSVKI